MSTIRRLRDAVMTAPDVPGISNVLLEALELIDSLEGRIEKLEGSAAPVPPPAPLRCQVCGAEYEHPRSACINTTVRGGELDACGGSVSAAPPAPEGHAPQLSEVFRAGWDAGFQEALLPDEHPEQNRCAVAFDKYCAELAAVPPPVSPEPTKEEDVPAWLQIRAGSELDELVRIVRFITPGQVSVYLHSEHDAAKLLWRWALKWFASNAWSGAVPPWQPIASAPKVDGRLVLLHPSRCWCEDADGTDCEVGYWDNVAQCWVAQGPWAEDYDGPTHWMPLPAPPSDAEPQP